MRRRGWIDPDHHAAHRRRGVFAAAFQKRARPQRAGQVVDQFAVQFLSAQQRAAEFPLDIGDKAARQVRGIVEGRTARNDDVVLFQ